MINKNNLRKTGSNLKLPSIKSQLWLWLVLKIW